MSSCQRSAAEQRWGNRGSAAGPAVDREVPAMAVLNPLTQTLYQLT